MVKIARNTVTVTQRKHEMHKTRLLTKQSLRETVSRSTSNISWADLKLRWVRLFQAFRLYLDELSFVWDKSWCIFKAH